MLVPCIGEDYMAGWHLDTKMAQDIVARTMRIIDTNINVMDARGRIIGSGDRERIGELHEGALLVLSQGRVVDIDDAVARHLHGVRQGINLPLRLEGEIVGVIGLTGEPESLRKYGELVCMTAEMMLEQSRLMHLLAQDSRLREELVMNLIQAEEHTPALNEWAQRLGIDLNQPRVVAMIEVDSGQLGVDSAMAELQQSNQNQVDSSSIFNGIQGAEMSNKGQDKGVVVSNVKAGTPAAQIGLKKGDIIVGANQQPVKNIADLRKIFDAKPSVLALNIQRGDTSIYLLMQ